MVREQAVRIPSGSWISPSGPSLSSQSAADCLLGKRLIAGCGRRTLSGNARVGSSSVGASLPPQVPADACGGLVQVIGGGYYRRGSGFGTDCEIWTSLRILMLRLFLERLILSISPPRIAGTHASTGPPSGGQVSPCHGRTSGTSPRTPGSAHVRCASQAPPRPAPLERRRRGRPPRRRPRRPSASRLSSGFAHRLAPRLRCANARVTRRCALAQRRRPSVVSPASVDPRSCQKSPKYRLTFCDYRLGIVIRCCARCLPRPYCAGQCDRIQGDCDSRSRRTDLDLDARPLYASLPKS